LPSCVTDAKGRLQFRVWLAESGDGALWVAGPGHEAAELEARLTRYLIADDVEVLDLTEKWRLVHFTGDAGGAPAGVLERKATRFGVAGADWWIPEGMEVGFPGGIPLLEGDGLEAFRIRQGVPGWGSELAGGVLPPEAGLEAFDISYQKGCYIGQEVISRIKSAGKVNKRLVRLELDGGIPVLAGLGLEDAEGKPVGRLTSVSPLVENGVRHALGYVNRGAGDVFCGGRLCLQGGLV
jgi:folate-binding protein YgfZ